ncbi:MAG TPA: AarF/ABC1/UbiB kinase family protein [Acidimicrobiales bacterium]|nr:AarF/ABC1/UbiB kinase family protein [Acidimicrobiales bacterium]
MTATAWARAAAVAAAATATGGAIVLADPLRRTRLRRAAQVWWLGAGRARDLATHSVRRAWAPAEQRAELDTRFAIRSAEDTVAAMGEMKGAFMKIGQLLGFILEGLPEEAQQAFAALQADAPPMAPELAERVIREELGEEPSRRFARWDPQPVAAASIGQVHRAVLRDGRQVAVKVQYPGVDRAIRADLDNVEVLYGLFSAFALKGLDVRAIVDELRARMGDELDYRLEAAHQAGFARRYRGHPFIHVPDVVSEHSTARVLTSEWVDGSPWAEFVAQADQPAKERAGEVIWRFAQASIIRHGVFNGDPHPGNYRFHADGSVTFLDFGLVKRWSADEWLRLEPCLDAIIDQQPARLVQAMEDVRFLESGHGLDADEIYAYVSAPYRPYLTDSFRFTRDFTADTIARVADVNGPYAHVVRKLNLPPSFVILDRVVWGISALLGKLEVGGPWRAMLDEYRKGGPPATPLGELDARWWTQQAV